MIIKYFEFTFSPTTPSTFVRSFSNNPGKISKLNDKTVGANSITHRGFGWTNYFGYAHYNTMDSWWPATQTHLLAFF